MDRIGPCADVSEAAMRIAGAAPIELVLRTDGDRERRQPAFDASDRRVVPSTAVLWIPTDHALAQRAGMGSERKTRGAADADYEFAGDIAGSAYEQATSAEHDLPVSSERPANQCSERGVVCGYHVYSAHARIHVSGGCDGLVQSVRFGLGTFQHAGRSFLRGGFDQGDGRARAAGNFQYRSRLSVHGGGIHRRVETGRSTDQHGWSRPGIGQRVCGTVVAIGQI